MDPPLLFCEDPETARTDFPCNANSIKAVSLALGAAGCALLFVYWLLQKVSCADLLCVFLHGTDPSVCSFKPKHLAALLLD